MAFLDSTGLAHLVSKLKTWTQNLISSLSPDGKTIKNTSGQMVAYDIYVNTTSKANELKYATNRGYLADRGLPTVGGVNQSSDSSKLTVTDFNLLCEPGLYHIRVVTADVLNGPPATQAYHDGILIVRCTGGAVGITGNLRISQIYIRGDYRGIIDSIIYTRHISGNFNSEGTFVVSGNYDWNTLITTKMVGEGLEYSPYKLKVKNGFAYDLYMPQLNDNSQDYYYPDLNDLITPGRYHTRISLTKTLNVPYDYAILGATGPNADDPYGFVTAIIDVDRVYTDGYVSDSARIVQKLRIIPLNINGRTFNVTYERVLYWNTDTGVNVQSDWQAITKQGYGVIGPNTVCLNRGFSKGDPYSNDYILLSFYGEDYYSKNAEGTENRLAVIQYAHASSLRGINMRVYKNEVSSTDSVGLDILYNDDGKKVVLTQSPPADSNDKSIATTEWVRDYVQSVLNS